jgi:Tol biopolymer transport system component
MLNRRTCAVATAVVGAVLVLTAAGAVATAPGDNGQIAFRRYLGPDRTSGAIFTIAPDGTAERQLTRPPRPASDDFPDFAANGSFVAFQRCRDACAIYTVRADGSKLKRVGPAPGCAGSGARRACHQNSYPAVSPDGRRIAFVREFGRLRNEQIEHVGIYTMRADGSQVRRVTLPRTRTAEDRAPQWSPDGRRIVFVRHNESAKPAGRQAVFVVGAGGTGARRVTPWKIDAGDGPDWSPDGNRILFRAPESDDFLESDLFTIRTDGSDLRQVTHAPANTKVFSASFSPDGTAITLGLSGIDGEADVFRMGIDGGGPVAVTRTASWDSAPDWGGAR